MAATLSVPRSRGAFSGVLLILLGIWGGLVPLVGPYLHYAYTPDRAWAVTSGRIWLEFLPAAGAVVGGVMMAVSKFRPAALIGASVAAASGAWFAFGSLLTRLWMRTPPGQGTAVGGSFARTIEQIGFFSGLGAVIICVAAVALGRLSVISARDLRLAERTAQLDAQAAAASPQDPDPQDTYPQDTDPQDAEEFRPERAVTVPAATSTTTTTRRAPMAVLTRIASRNRSADQDDTTESSSAKERVSSSA